MIFLVTLNTTIFILIAVLHLYWAAGGKNFSGSVLPVTENDVPTFVPGAAVTFAVATGLFFFAFITVAATDIFNAWLNTAFAFYGNCVITLIFVVRVIGDFKYVGFFKKISRTKFAANDTKFYSPLCLLIAFCAAAISYKLYAGE